MTEGGKKTTKKEAVSGSIKSGLAENRQNIERVVEDIFRKIESKPETVPRRQEIIDDIADIRIEIAEKDIQKPAPGKNIQTPEPVNKGALPKPAKNLIKKMRPLYLSGAVLVVAAALIFFTIKPQHSPAPDKPAATETLYKIVQPVPDSRVQSREEKIVQPVPGSDTQPREDTAAQSIPAGARKSEELKAFLLKWKTAWEHTAGKGGDMETFMSFYSDSFNSKGMTRNEWRNDKAQKNSQKEWIRLELKNIHIVEAAADNRTQVNFLLAYSSSNYSDETFQTLILKKEADNWKIIEIGTAND